MGKNFFKSLLWSLILLPNTLHAEGININMGGGSASAKILQLIIFLTAIALLPYFIVMMTSFTRIVVVLSFVRSAIGLQQSPPNMVLISLATFLTFFIMSPTLEKVYHEAIAPMIEEKIDEKEAMKRAGPPMHKFMIAQVREEELSLFSNLSSIKEIKKKEDTPWRILLPAFLISELKRAFEMGFLVFVPFVVIDIVVSSLLMAVGMMMVPPSTVALPIKIIFFTMIDGWSMLVEGIVKSFGN